MSAFDRALLRIIERLAPAEIAPHVAGDLAEEASQVRDVSGDAKARMWLLRHSTLCGFRCVAMRLRRADAPECVAAAAFFVALPLTAVLTLRRYALWLVPYRESLSFSNGATATLAIVLAGLAAWQVSLLGPRRREWIPVLLSTAFTGLIAIVTGGGLSGAQIAALITAAGFGASAATLGKKGDIK